MDVVLVPGLWLDGASWEQVTSKIEKAGHRAHPVTLPGMDDKEMDRSEPRWPIMLRLSCR